MTEGLDATTHDVIRTRCDIQLGASVGWYGDGFRALWIPLDQLVELCIDHVELDPWGSIERFLVDMLGVDPASERSIDHQDSTASLHVCQSVEDGSIEQSGKPPFQLEILTDENGRARIRAETGERLLDRVKDGVVGIRERVVEVGHSVQLNVDPTVVVEKYYLPIDPRDYCDRRSHTATSLPWLGDSPRSRPSPEWVPIWRRERRFAVEIDGRFRWTPWLPDEVEDGPAIELDRHLVERAIECLDSAGEAPSRVLTFELELRHEPPFMVAAGFEVELPFSPTPPGWRLDQMTTFRDEIVRADGTTREIVVSRLEGPVRALDLDLDLEYLLWAHAFETGPEHVATRRSQGVCLVEGRPALLRSIRDPTAGPSLDWIDPIDPRSWPLYRGDSTAST